jgi:gas vesicle protein
MAIFGDLGKILGLGTAQETVQAITGSPIAGRAAGVVSRGVSGLADRGTQQGQAVAVSVPSTAPQETQASSTIGGPTLPAAGYPTLAPTNIALTIPSDPTTAMMGGMIQPAMGGALVQGGRALVTPGASSFLRNLFIGGAAGFAAPMILDPITGQEKKLRVTRKLRSQVKNAVNLVGIETVAEIMNTNVEVIVYIMTKKMRNDGPYVTKAAVRKTRATVRKMKSLCDMYDDLRPMAKRRAPARRATSTRVVQVK